MSLLEPCFEEHTVYITACQINVGGKHEPGFEPLTMARLRAEKCCAVDDWAPHISLDGGE